MKFDPFGRAQKYENAIKLQKLERLQTERDILAKECSALNTINADLRGQVAVLSDEVARWRKQYGMLPPSLLPGGKQSSKG